MSEEKRRQILQRSYFDKKVRDRSNIRRLDLRLHHEQEMMMEVSDDNFKRAIEEIERGGNRHQTADIPLEERGGEVLESVNEVFNLMAMKIDLETKARRTVESTLKYKNQPNVIYIKNPRDRLLKMTEHVDQSLQFYPRDSRGLYGGRFPFQYEKNEEKIQKELEEKELKRQAAVEKEALEKI